MLTNSNIQPVDYTSILSKRPNAIAMIKGSNKYPQIIGNTKFYNTKHGVLVAAEIFGLPTNSNICESPIFAFHIHSGNSCSGNDTDPFANAMSHYNPNNCNHPYHAGDLPPLFGNNGYALNIFITDRFTIDKVIGKTIIIHSHLDDFTTQPSGDSGEKIACGIIKFIGRS